MVNMSMNDVEMEDSLEKSKKEALKLGSDKMKLEDELKEWLSILAKNNLGMDEALVDAEGYPRSDIDVYQVRHARHRIICIRNDLKNIMAKIEEHLSIIHSLNDGSSSQNIQTNDVVYRSPIAKVGSVSSGSPADEAGLKVGDSILSFGSVQFDNFTDIKDIANVVQHSLNQLIKVTVDRDERILKLYLKPHKWSGPGVLGCNILPHEHVER